MTDRHPIERGRGQRGAARIGNRDHVMLKLSAPRAYLTAGGAGPISADSGSITAFAQIS